MTACKIDVPLDGKQCPCGPGYWCADDGVCVLGQRPDDAGQPVDSGVNPVPIDSGVRLDAAVPSDTGVMSTDSGVIIRPKDEWTYPDFVFRRLLLLSPGSAGQSEPEDVFPFLVRITDPSITSEISSSGDDLRFTTREGDLIVHDLEQRTEAGELSIWVRLPGLSPEPVGVWMYYGQLSEITPVSSAEVWAEDFDAVFHMQEAEELSFLNSTSSDRNATSTSTNSQVTQEPGQIALSMLIEEGSDFEFESTSWTGDATLMMWLRPTDTTTGATPISWQANDGNQTLSVNYDASDESLTIRSTRGDQTTAVVSTASGAVSVNQWVHVAIRYRADSDRTTLWVNGQREAEDILQFDLSTSGRFSLGQRTDGGQPYSGQIDALWLIKSDKSDAWIQAIYENQKDPSAEISVSLPEFNEDSIGEAGRAEVSHEWQTIRLRRTYQNPVVVASIVTIRDATPCITRIQTLTSTSFQLRVQEWADDDIRGGPETVHYVVLEEGFHMVRNRKIEAGTLPLTHDEASQGLDEGWAESVPLVFTQVTTTNDPDPVNIDQDSLRADSFTLGLRARGRTIRPRISENVAYIAAEQLDIPTSGWSIGTQKLDWGDRDNGNQIRFIWDPPPRTSLIVVGTKQTTLGPDASSIRFNYIESEVTDTVVIEDWDASAHDLQEIIGVLGVEPGHIMRDP